MTDSVHFTEPIECPVCDRHVKAYTINPDILIGRRVNDPHDICEVDGGGGWYFDHDHD